FLIYYSQEARMYALAASLGAAAVFCASRWWSDERGKWAAGYTLLGVAGLFTHYSFAFVLAAVNLAGLITLRPRRGQLARWLGLQAAVLVLYLPWLPTAWRQVSTWPSAREFRPVAAALVESWRWIIYGSTVETGVVAAGLVAAGMLALAGLLSRRALAPALWLAVPVGLTLAFGLFTEAFAKFLLVAAPTACVLAGNGIAAAVRAIRRARAGKAPSDVFFFGAIAATLVIVWLRFDVSALANLYTDPTYFRADYRAMAAAIANDARPGDAVLLNAPNQWEVFTYYYPHTANVYPVARSRPLDAEAQIAELEQIAAAHDRLFVLYWGDAQADPGRVVESWLNANTFKARDEWYRDVRLSTYAVPQHQTAPVTPVGAMFGESIQLDGYTLNSTDVDPGDILQLALYWSAQAPVEVRYKVFVHVVADPFAPPAAQQDGEPGGGLVLTTTWQPGTTIVDRHGVVLPTDLPPGEYDIRVGLYGAADGVRLPVRSEGEASGDSLLLHSIRVHSP
ncbi:MAG: hypothetical protein ACE5FI_15135, partial [Anaerolineales bacterium]